MAYCNLGNILKDRKITGAFDAFIKVIEINPTFSIFILCNFFKRFRYISVR